MLTLLFMKYVSDKFVGRRGEIRVPPGGSFADMATLKGHKNIGEECNTIITALAEANGLKGVIDLEREVETNAAKVATHLQRMGLAW